MTGLGPLGPLKPGTRIMIHNGWSSEELQVLKYVSDTHVSVTESVPTKPLSVQLVPHKTMGHSFWPVNRKYECSRCGMVKRPGSGAGVSCDNFLLDAVHDR